MSEKLLHFVWKYRPFTISGLSTTLNQRVEIIDPGQQNFDAGPDFFNAKVKIGNTIWAGNVEMHLRASDWFVHGHQTDTNYDNVILHVVIENDRQALNTLGYSIPTLVVPYPKNLEQNLDTLVGSAGWVPCHNRLENINNEIIPIMLQRLMVERIEQKTLQVIEQVRACKGSWEEAFYRSIAHGFGLKVNALPAELLAKSLPLHVLGKHRNSLFQLEALLFGQAGMLDTIAADDDYFRNLKKEYRFLAQKFSLTPIDGTQWKFLRMRPIGFPTVRLAQFAALINRSSALFSKLIEATNVKQIDDLLSCQTSEYWRTHYTFQKTAPEKSKPIGQALKTTIIINTVIPFLFAYGKNHNNDTLINKALQFFEDLPAEDNSVVNGFKLMGIKARSAADSQALLQLKSSRCDVKKCMFCDIGVALLAKSELY